MNSADAILFSGGAPGAEGEFGGCAERHGIEEAAVRKKAPECPVLGRSACWISAAIRISCSIFAFSIVSR